MADESNSSDEKTEEPTQYRLEEARNKGEVASSKEVISVAILFFSIFTIILFLSYIYEVLEAYLIYIINYNYQKVSQVVEVIDLIQYTAITLGKCSFPVLGVTLIIGVIFHLVQIGFIYAPDVLSFKWERLDPVQGFKRLVSLNAIKDTFKSIFKFSIIILIAGSFFQSELLKFNGFLQLDLVGAFKYSQGLILKLFLSILGGLTVVALLDFIYEKYQYRKKLFMSKAEVKRESKEREGNPEIKSRIRSIQRAMSSKRMSQEVPKADVVVTNPTHFSVAIKYTVGEMVSPMVVAKGVDEMALLIRRIAKEHNVPIIENIPLARNLYHQVDLNRPIPRNLYRAVAEILAFVYRLKKKEKALSLE